MFLARTRTLESDSGAVLNQIPEAAPVKVIDDPLRPSKIDIDKHQARGHLPFRNWCSICVKARCVEGAHRPQVARNLENRDPISSCDCCFPSSADDPEHKMVVLVSKW